MPLALKVEKLGGMPRGMIAHCSTDLYVYYSRGIVRLYCSTVAAALLPPPSSNSPRPPRTRSRLPPVFAALKPRL